MSPVASLGEEQLLHMLDTYPIHTNIFCSKSTNNALEKCVKYILSQ